MKELLQENGWLGVAFILTLQFVYTIWKDKQKTNDDALKANTAAILKLQKELNRYYFGLKYLAGDKWPQVSSFIQTDPSREKDV